LSAGIEKAALSQQNSAFGLFYFLMPRKKQNFTASFLMLLLKFLVWKNDNIPGGYSYLPFVFELL